MLSISPAQDSTVLHSTAPALHVTELGAKYNSVELSDKVSLFVDEEISNPSFKQENKATASTQMILIEYGIPIGITVGSGLLIYTLFSVRGKK